MTVTMTNVVHRLHLANVDYGDSEGDGRLPVYGYLIVTGSQPILVDTGVGSGNAYIDKHFRPERFVLTELLKTHDVEPQDVAMLINSHLHFDHCGDNALFPNAEIFVQANELEIAHSPAYTVTEWFDYDHARIHTVEGTLNISEGVTLIHTPGHTPGHQSILVDTEEGVVTIAAQAAYTAQEYLSGGDPGKQAHEGYETQYRDSIDTIKSLNCVDVLFSHDDSSVSAHILPNPA